MNKELSLKKMRKMLSKAVDEKRYEHTLGVEYTAAALAMRWGASIKSARIAGLLHDCAKCVGDVKSRKICIEAGIEMSEMEDRNPFLLHGKVGAYFAENKYGITDEDILNAIANHTTGRKGMSLLEKIIFIADYIEPGRKQAANLEQIRKMAFIDLDGALIKILGDTLEYLENSGKEIDEHTKTTYDYYCAVKKDSDAAEKES